MGTLAQRGGPVVGYDPVDLDRQLKRYLAAAEKNLGMLEDLGKPLAEKAKTDTAGLDLEEASIVYDRLVKGGLNLVKALDELSRLRSFLSGGPDTRPDLSSLGETELTGIFVNMVRALGVTRVQQIIDAEVVG